MLFEKKFPHEQILNQEFLAFQVIHKHSSAVYSDKRDLELDLAPELANMHAVI